jgi:ribosomal-protein-alanine N-acetyltransferase
MEPTSPRLTYRRLAPAQAAAFHALVADPHVRRYMMDGRLMEPAWSRAVIEDSERLFGSLGLGLWLVSERGQEDAGPVGFVGFRIFEDMHPEPQLLYAFVEAATGRGYATEASEALLRLACDPADPTLAEIHAAVDAPNAASLRVLEKLGFERTGELPGAFGATYTFRWRRPEAA